MARLTRRRLLIGGGAAGVLAAGGAAGLLLARGDDRAPERSPTPPSPGATTTATPVASPVGLARVHAPAGFNFDTFDALRSGEPSVLEVLGRTHSRLVDWVDPPGAILGPALARSWEQPEPGRLVLHLEPAARWQPIAPLDGAPVTAADVRAFLRRAIELAAAGQMPALQRPHDWAHIEKVSDARGTVAVETKSPEPFLLHTLASRFALVQSPRAVEAFESTWHELRPDTTGGSGSFICERLDGGVVRFRAHEASPSPPRLDRLEVSEPEDVVARFRDNLLDEAILRDRRDAPVLLGEFGGQLTRLTRFEDSPVISTVFAGAPPWNNADLRLAISAALNRGELARRLFAGRAIASGPVAPAHTAFALPESDLATTPGYRADLATDFADARRRWESAGGPALGPLTLDIPAIFDPLYSASSVVAGMLREALGVEVIVRVDTYAAISARAAAQEYGGGRLALWFGWGPPLLEPDPSRYLLETFGSKSPAYAVTGYLDTALDLALARLATLTDLNERKESVKQIQRLLLSEGGGGVFPWLLQRSEVLRRPFYHAPPPTPFWQQHQSAAASIGTTDPGYAAGGR